MHSAKTEMFTLITSLFIFASATALPTDADLKAVLEKELQESPVVDAADFGISVRDGIVTLEGEVLNIAAKKRAIEVAKRIRGINSVIDLVEVAVVPRTDKRLRQLVEKRLRENPATNDEEVTVKTRAGEVILSGEVDSRVESGIIQRTVQSIPGVLSIDNRIRVTWTSNRNDEDILHDIEQRIRWDVRLDDKAIEVKVKNGEVQLSGTVGSEEERMHARLASRVEASREIRDELIVDPSLRDDVHRDPRFERRSAVEIEQTIRKAWKLDPRVENINAEISITVGTVRLHGTVAALRTKHAAEDTARNTVGVSHVNNYLRVVRDEHRTDDQIQADIDSAFIDDPLVDRFEIEVTVNEGKASLYGKLDSHYEKARAEEVALRIPGIVELKNRLEVSDDAPEYDENFYAYAPVTTADDDLGTIHIRPDSDIKHAIESELWWSPMVDADQVKLKVEAGVATLTGTVDSAAEMRAAVKNAMQGGAVVVKNRLQVQR